MNKFTFIAIVLLLCAAGMRFADHIEQRAYQAKAMRCAQAPDMPGCEAYQTAAGSEVTP